MKRRISSSDAARNFAAVIDRVYRRREQFIVERGGVPVSQISPVKGTRRTLSDLAALLQSLPTPDKHHLRTVDQLVARQPATPRSPWRSFAVERRTLDLALLASLGDEAVALAAITASELLHGVYRAGTARIRSRRSAFVEGLLGEYPIIPFDAAAARVHAKLWSQLAARGSPSAPMTC